MKSKRAVRVVLDVALAFALVAVMSTALVEEAPHEWLGIVLLVLTAAHVVLNRKWLASMFRGRHNALRVLQIVVIAGLALCVVGQIASSLVLSKHVFGFLPALPGSGWARRVHMLCSYWMFILAFAHVGLHTRFPKGLSSWQMWVIRIVCAAAVCLGIYSSVRLGIWSYLTGQVQFAHVDYDAPLVLTGVRYASVAAFVVAVFHCVHEGILRSVKK